MIRTKSRTLAFAAVALAFVLAAACSSSGGGDASGGGSGDTNREIVIAQASATTRTPDPLMDQTLTGYAYYYNMFDQLTTLDASGKVRPGLATEWKSNDDLTQWTYTIRKGVSFHDGSPLTTQDIVFSYQTVMNTPTSGNYGFIRSLASVKAVDDSTILFTLKAPFSVWPNITTTISIVPQAVYTALGSEGFARAPVGSGPYKFVSWTNGVSYVIERNDAYWGTKPQIKKVTFQVVADESARANGVVSGSLDISLVPPNQAEAIKGSANVTANQSNTGVFLVINPASGPLAKTEVRKAIWESIDRNAIVKGILGGKGVANEQVLAPSVIGYVKDFKGPGYNVADAKKLLAQAGYAGEQVDFTYPTESGQFPFATQIAQAIGEYMKQVGINVNLIGMDNATLSVKRSNKAITGMVLGAWGPSTMDGDNEITNLFQGGTNDFAMSPVTSQLVDDQRRAQGDARIDVYRKLAQFTVDNAYYVPVFTPDTSYASAKDLTWDPRADGLYVVSDMKVS